MSRWWIAKLPASRINLPSRHVHAYWTAAERRTEFDHMVATSLEIIGSACVLLLATIVIVTGLDALSADVPGWVLTAALAIFLGVTVASLGYVVRQTRVPPAPS
ncbi:hypothetical protein AB0M12_13080 [Nocardia vinacea]|uniref:hypothetical protein n=1 Tax=Nocardia vinacea TaxID=96468 RepID=UPI0034222075